jgi:hypothetical protein
MSKLKQQEIQIIRVVTVPAISGRRVKISSPLFTHLSGPDIVPLLQVLLLDRLATELTDPLSANATAPTPRMEDLSEPAHLLLQIADALQPTREPTQVESNPSSFWMHILPPLP